MVAQSFNPIPEFVLPKGIPTDEAKPEIETQPVKAKVKISMCLT